MKYFKGTAFFAGIIFILALVVYSVRGKNTSMLSELEPSDYSSESVPAASSAGTMYASANGIQTTMPNNLPSQHSMSDPSALLPNDTNSQWASLNPSGNGALQSVNLLQAGHLIGLNTQGSSLRNANLQLRSEPTIEKKDVGPWMHSTIDADNLRKPLEIGGSL